jgi:hypothetical protein
MRDDQITLTTGISYSPSTLLQLFNTALSPSPTKNIIVLKAIYQPRRSSNYNGFFYDQLKDEATACIAGQTEELADPERGLLLCKSS